MAVQSHVEFRSSLFPPYPEEDETINPGRYGRRLAEYLARKLGERGVAAGAPYCEDWGVVLPVAEPSLPVWIGCGNYEEYPDGFLCFIEPAKPGFLGIFSRASTAGVVARAADVLGAILASEPGIRDIRWWNGRHPQ